MKRSRKLLTLLAMVAFIVIIFTVGYNQSPYTDLQIEFGRGRVWGLTPLGISLAILIVIYAGLFAIAPDDGFLTRHRRGLKRLVIALVALCALAGAGYVGVNYFNTMQQNARRAEERAVLDRQRQAAQADWEQMTPEQRGSTKINIRFGFIPDSPKERERLEALKNFVPEAYKPMTDEETGRTRPNIFDRFDARPPSEIAKDARADWETMTPPERGYFKLLVGLPDKGRMTDRDKARLQAFSDFVPEIHQSLNEQEKAGLQVDARPPWEIAKDAQADWKAMTAKQRREMKDAVRLGFVPDSPKERERMHALKDFVPEVYQPETAEERKTHPLRKGDIVSEEEALGKPKPSPDERWKSDPIVQPAPSPTP